MNVKSAVWSSRAILALLELKFLLPEHYVALKVLVKISVSGGVLVFQYFTT